MNKIDLTKVMSDYTPSSPVDPVVRVPDNAKVTDTLTGDAVAPPSTVDIGEDPAMEFQVMKVVIKHRAYCA